MKQSPLVPQLEEEYASIKRLRERISELRYDMDDAQHSIKVYYAVDFSEIYAYLNIDKLNKDDMIGVNLDNRHPEKSALQYRLGLTHLFHTFDDTLYMLPPHTIELWTFARGQGRRKQADATKYSQLLDRTRRLAPEHQRLLESLRDIARAQEVSGKLLEFIKSPDFGPLCLDVSEFVSWYKKGNALRELIQTNKFSYQIDHILAEHKISFSQMKEPSREDILEVLQRASSERRHKKRTQTIIDARALFLLKRINQLLGPKNAKVVLITRDANIYEIVKSIADKPWFGWPEVREHIRGIESIFLDLVLTGTLSTNERSAWILESDLKLATMQESIGRILHQLNRSATSQVEVNTFASMGKKVLDETAKLWDQHINLRLSLASNHVPWLGKSFVELDPEAELPADFRHFRQEYSQLKNLFEFLSTETYQTLANSDVETVWSDIEADCLRMGFLNVLGREGAERVSKVLTETFRGDEGLSKTIVRSKRFLRMPSVQFVSKPYQNRLKALQVSRHGKYNQAFLSVVYEAVSGFNEPEDFLFMAFVLGMIDEWSEALILIEKCREMLTAIHPSKLLSLIDVAEVDYLASLIKRRLAELQSDPVESMEGFVKAFADIKHAMEIKATDPRYIKDAAAIAMLYHEVVKKASLWPLSSSPDVSLKLDTGIPTEAEAMALYSKALQLLNDKDDLRLRVSILNNLAYSEVLSDSPAYEEAENYLRQIDDLLKIDDGGESQLPLIDGVLPNITDTKIMLQARKAKDERSGKVLRTCISEMESLLLQESLSRAEQRTYRSHIDILKSWLEEVGS